MSILGETLEPFDDDGYIPAYGFGDISTRDKDVFPFVSQVVTSVLQFFNSPYPLYLVKHWSRLMMMVIFQHMDLVIYLQETRMSSPLYLR